MVKMASSAYCISANSYQNSSIQRRSNPVAGSSWCGSDLPPLRTSATYRISLRSLRVQGQMANSPHVASHAQRVTCSGFRQTVGGLPIAVRKITSPSDTMPPHITEGEGWRKDLEQRSNRRCRACERECNLAVLMEWSSTKRTCD
jgi:hypothetical protein